MVGYLPVNRGFYNCLIIKGGEKMKKILKNTSKILTGLLVLTFIFVVTLGNADAKTAPSSITVKRAEVLSDMVTNHDHGFTIFTTSDGQYIYCLDVDKKPLVSGQTATLSTNGDAGLLYLLQNGYPNKTITGNTEIDKYVTQAAVWWYMDVTGQGGKMSNEFKNADETDIYKLIPKYIKPMVEKAQAAKDTQAKPSMDFKSGSTTFTLTSDGKYYESAYMSASLVGAKTYNVEISGGTKNTVVVDEQGNVGTTMNSSERFKVRVPAAELTEKADIKVKVTATGSIQKAKIYKPSDASYQRVIGLYDENVALSDSVSLSAKPKAHVCEVDGDKYYGKDGTEVDESTYKEECEPVRSCEFTDDKYYGKDGNEVDKATFDKECGEEVIVPNTSSNVSTLGIVGGMSLLATGAGLIAYRRKQLF